MKAKVIEILVKMTQKIDDAREEQKRGVFRIESISAQTRATIYAAEEIDAVYEPADMTPAQIHQEATSLIKRIDKIQQPKGAV